MKFSSLVSSTILMLSSVSTSIINPVSGSPLTASIREGDNAAESTGGIRQHHVGPKHGYGHGHGNHGGRRTQSIFSTLPDEASDHTATWIVWPHRFTYGAIYAEDLEPAWVEMTQAMVNYGGSEILYIVVYNAQIQRRATNLLRSAGISDTQLADHVVFVTIPTDDVWIRDFGPMFVYSLEYNNDVEIINWNFNGWGNSVRDYWLDNQTPTRVGNYLNMFVYDESSVTLEGGAIEVDGRGTLMATKSSVLENGRNRWLSQQDVEGAMEANMGVTNVIWLDGRAGGTDDITDYHIDGFARFATTSTIVTMDRPSLITWGITEKDINTLYAASDVDGKAYEFVTLPLTQNNVITTYGEDLGFQGSYVNFYSANNVVMMPSYNDPNDDVAMAILQSVYPDRTVVKIDSRNLIANGGMVHCVTKEQAAAWSA